MPERITPAAAVEAVVDFSRVAADTNDPARVLDELTDRLLDLGEIDAVAGLLLDAEGRLEVVTTKGSWTLVDGITLDSEPGMITPDVGAGILDASGGRLTLERTLPLMSGGRLFGAVVLLWADPEAEPSASRLTVGLVEMAAMAIDKALQHTELAGMMAKLRASQEKLARTEQLRALGQMAAVVAHEVRNPLASISGVLQVLRGRFAHGSSEQGVIASVLERLSELDMMVEELLVFARPRRPQLVEIELAAVIRSAAREVTVHPRWGGIELDIEAPAVRLRGDANLLRQILVNLLLNASQAMDGGGRGTVRVEQDDATVRIVVSDSGPGVPEDRREQIFEPFVTTKTRGTGLGLAVGLRIAEAHGGTLRCEAARGGGARFVVELPVDPGLAGVL